MAESLSEAILADDYDAAVKLIQQNIGINSQDGYGFLPIIHAVIRENLPIIRLLLEHGANIDERDISGSSALTWAANDNQVDICKLLLSYKACPNLYDTSGQPVLSNVRLRDQQELISLLVDHGANINFAKDYNNTKLIGHRFELTGKADISNHNGHFVEMSFEGFTSEFTLGLIRQSLITFHNTHIGKKFSHHMGKIHEIISRLEIAQNFRPPVYKRRRNEHSIKITPLLSNSFLIIPVSYHGHAISFVKFGNLLAKCDRGVNNIADTIIIYRVQNPYRLNNQLLQKLIYEHNDEHFIHTEIREILSLESVATLPTRSQISGNCSWANIEAGVIAALFMLNYHQYNTNDKTKITALKKDVMAFYDAWIEWDKDRTVDDCIEDFYNADELVRRTSKATILCSILFQRCNHNIASEVKRAKKILSILTLDEYKYLLKSYIDIYCTPTAGPIGEKFTALLLKCGLNLKKISLNKNVLKPVIKRRKANINSITLLHRAAANGNLKAIKEMFKKDKKLDVDALDHTGSSALIYAALKGNFLELKYLIEQQSANYKLINDKGGSALKYALHANHTEVIEYLENLHNTN